MNPYRWPLYGQILLALLLAVVIAAIFLLTGSQESSVAAKLVAGCSFVGDIFLNALKMIVVPLVVTSIIAGMAGLGAKRHFGRIGLRALVYYLTTGFLAITVGLILVNWVQPGQVSPETAQRLLAQAADSSDVVSAKVGTRSGADIVAIFLRMVPGNIVAAAQDNGQLLGLIFFSLLFGFFVSYLPQPYRTFQETLWESWQQVMVMFANFIIRFAPLGVFSLVLPKIILTGFALIVPVSKFFICVLLGLSIHFLVTLAIILWTVARVNPIAHYRALMPALLTAFSTASSVSTLPVTLDCVRHNCGISKKISSFLLPLGATMNMDGTALYECVVVVFIAQFYAVVDPAFALSWAQQFQVLLLALFTSIGVAGIPSASLVAIAVILGAVGLPLEYIGIVMVVDRLLDMCRTAVNIFGDSVGAVVVARLEGETPHYSG